MIHHILSEIVFMPAIGALILLLLPSGMKNTPQNIAAAIGSITLGLAVFATMHFDSAATGMQFVESFDWIQSFQISYALGLDGLGLALVLIASLIFFLAYLFPVRLEGGERGFYALFLLLESTVLGLFVAQDFFLFLTFWIMMLVPIYFMISIWGGKNREYASGKFFVYQLVGCALLFLGMLAVYYNAQPHTFSLQALNGGSGASGIFELGGKGFRFDRLVFVVIFIGIAIRLPLAPFHNWFAHAQQESPAPLAAVLAAIFVKTGVYALIRINYALFPQAAQELAIFIGVLAVVNILYGALCALAQNDLRKIASYGTISQMGIIILGFSVFSKTSFHGAILQILSHATASALLFFMVGTLGSRARHHNIVLEDGAPGFGGLALKTPVLTVFFTIAVFSAIGVPGLGSFSSELLVLMGVFPAHRLFTIAALVGVVITAAYLLWMYRRVFLGKLNSECEDMNDLNIRERLSLAPLVLLCFVIGFFPTPLIELATSTVSQTLLFLEGKK